MHFGAVYGNGKPIPTSTTTANFQSTSLTSWITVLTCSQQLTNQQPSEATPRCHGPRIETTTENDPLLERHFILLERQMRRREREAPQHPHRGLHLLPHNCRWRNTFGSWKNDSFGQSNLRQLAINTPCTKTSTSTMIGHMWNTTAT